MSCKEWHKGRDGLWLLLGDQGNYSVSSLSGADWSFSVHRWVRNSHTVKRNTSVHAEKRHTGKCAELTELALIGDTSDLEWDKRFELGFEPVVVEMKSTECK